MLSRRVNAALASSNGCPRSANAVLTSHLTNSHQSDHELESAFYKGGFQMLEIPKEALFLAGKAYLK